MNADDTDLAYSLEELAAAEEFFGVNLFDLIERPDPRVTDLTVNVASAI